MKNRLIVAIVLVGVVLTGAAIFFGAGIGRPNLPVTGRVVDAAGAPVNDASIKVIVEYNRVEGSPLPKNSLAHVKTDSKGRFSISGLPSGDGAFTVVAIKDGEMAEQFVPAGKQVKNIKLSLPIYAKDPAKIPAVDPAKDVITDKDGMQIIKDVAEIVWNNGVTGAEQDEVIAKIPGAKLRGRISEFKLTEIGTPPGKLEETIALLKQDPKVKGAFKDYVAEPDFSAKQIKDPDYSDNSKNWWLKKVELEEAWGVKTANPRMIVAVIDAGFQKHADLPGVYLKGIAKNYSSEAIGKDPKHGNHVSGIIAMQPNDVGLLGAGFGVKIQPLKVVTFSQMADAIRLASDTPRVRVISMSMGMAWHKQNRLRASMGSPPFDAAWMNARSEEIDLIMISAAEYAKRKNRILVHSAGNDNMTANYNSLKTPIVVTVANLAADDSRSPSSNYGGLITVAAPGTNIWSTVGGNNWNYLSGTSMSTPLVSGIISLVRSANLKLSVDETIEIIKKTSDLVPARNVGRRINAWKAVLAATGKWGVKGTVVTEGLLGGQVAGAKVYPEGMPELAVETDADGRFTIPGIPRGTWTLIAEKGKKKAKHNVIRLADDTYVTRTEVITLEDDKDAPQIKSLDMTFTDTPILNCTEQPKAAGATAYTMNAGMTISLGGPLDLNGDSFTMAPQSNEGGVTGVEIKSLNGVLGELKVGGRVSFSAEGVYLKDALPVKVQFSVSGVIDKQEMAVIDETEVPLYWQLKATSIKINNFTYDHPAKRGVCTYKFDPAIQNKPGGQAFFNLKANYDGVQKGFGD